MHRSLQNLSRLAPGPSIDQFSLFLTFLCLITFVYLSLIMVYDVKSELIVGFILHPGGGLPDHTIACCGMTLMPRQLRHAAACGSAA
jgi:hypothetical protein